MEGGEKTNTQRLLMPYWMNSENSNSKFNFKLIS